MHDTPKGIPVPDPGDDLLDAYEAGFNAAGVIQQSPSAAQARAVLAGAEANGVGPTVARPWYFDVGSRLFKADGSKTNDVFNLIILNEVEMWSGTYAGTWTNTLAKASFTGMIIADIGVKPYRRGIVADGVLYGAVSSGAVDACIMAQGAMKLARLDTGDAQSTSVTIQAVIPEGVQPSIRLGLRGGSPSGGRATLSHDPALNHLSVLAFPISM